jgi:hypothetical protein
MPRGIRPFVTALLPYLLALGLVPLGFALLLFILTRLESSLPSDSGHPLELDLPKPAELTRIEIATH